MDSYHISKIQNSKFNFSVNINCQWFSCKYQLFQYYISFSGIIHTVQDQDSRYYIF